MRREGGAIRYRRAVKSDGQGDPSLWGFLIAVMAGALAVVIAAPILFLEMPMFDGPVGIGPISQALLRLFAVALVFNTSVAMLISLPLTWLLRRYGLEDRRFYAGVGAVLGLLTVILWVLLLNFLLSVSSTKDGVVALFLLGALAGAATGLTWGHLRHRSKD